MQEKQPLLEVGISAVIPVFNSDKSLPEVVERLERVLAKIAPRFEIVLVDDGSRDASWEVIRGLSRAKRTVRGIRLLRNYGQHNALLCGIRAARHATTVILDDDGQHPPEEIPKLVRALEDGHDLVFGKPERQQHATWRNAASRLTKYAVRGALGAELASHVSAFKAFRTRIRRAFAHYEGAFVAIDVLLGWGAARVTSVPVRHDPRKYGQTNYDFRRLVGHALNMITTFSSFPLHLASVVGLFFTLFGLGTLSWVLGSYLIEGTSVAGFPFLASVIAIFSGAQLFALGIIGEYLARIHFRSMNKPAYAVGEEARAPQLVEAAE